MSTVYEVLVNATGNNTCSTAQQKVHFNGTKLKQKQEQQENTFRLKYKERKLILLEEF